ncbi:enoyl ACP reductase FabMG family protein [Trichlorobacter ammonificans]|uniref:Uncharacterized protein n=1 Tax=Trichlorobacter ammonificans TaxID=2916410 RepID=A0ABM9DB18_9BACT|nr:hypothetical protein [Trichlorobacter ammonificans]CAH2032388.1 conserved protein of unknown function [Trichlorobacter ammonificans]
MPTYTPLTTLPEAAGYRPGDCLVLIGELFGRGYANGLIEEARRLDMTVLGTTVGRRDSDGTLRALTPEELADAEKLLEGSIVNIPLEAGFDMESPDGEPPIAERLKKVKPDEWETVSFDDDFIRRAREAGRGRFRANLGLVMAELEQRIPAGANVIFAHTMAGGIPRARVFMPLLNRVFKGSGDKYLASEPFWNSGLGRLCDASFNEVTGDTLRHLIEVSGPLRERLTAAGGRVAYTAYGYHGTGILRNGAYCWQSYTPYLQGYAKILLEEHAAAARSQGVNATVFNCPEILTNSSALFLGVEISLYPLLTAIRSEAGDGAAALETRCGALLADGTSLEALLAEAGRYLTAPLIADALVFDGWPQHSTKEQMELMLAASARLMELHRDQKQLVCAELSRVVFRATGHLMVQASWSTDAPVLWLNHDIIARLAAVRPEILQAGE